MHACDLVERCLKTLGVVKGPKSLGAVNGVVEVPACIFKAPVVVNVLLCHLLGLRVTRGYFAIRLLNEHSLCTIGSDTSGQTDGNNIGSEGVKSVKSAEERETRVDFV